MALIISMPRGDLRPVRFTIQNPDGQQPEFEQSSIDQIYFTVKRNTRDSKMLFQKKLNGNDVEAITEVEDEPWTYEFTIQPEDTEWLAYGEYAFDIQISAVDDDDPSIRTMKQTTIGVLKITDEVTFPINEAGR